MITEIFDIKRDIEIVDAGGFFCYACLIGMPVIDQSLDPRYCQNCYKLLLEEASMISKKKEAYWSEGGQIYFCDGNAYSIDPNLKTVCIGSEADILKALKETKSLGNPAIDNILRLELNNRGNEKMPARIGFKRTRTQNKRVR